MSEGAFHGDPALKDEMLARIDSHAANGTLRFGATAWDGEGGSPMGVAIQGTDIAVYSEAYGYPLALSCLLDPLAALLRDSMAALDFTRGWAQRVTPGADLSAIPTRLVLFMLGLPEADRACPDLHAALIRLHERELAGEAVPREQWSNLRTHLLEAAERIEGRRDRAVLEIYEAAAWPARSSRSILTSMLGLWSNFAEYASDPDWSEADRQRAESILSTLWTDHENKVAPGEDSLSYPALFAAADPDLASRFEANLERINRSYKERIDAMAAIVLNSLAAAPMSPLSATDK